MDDNPEWYKDILLVDAKEFIRANINSASRSFVAIGYYLKYIRNNEMFTEDGYQSIWEFAKSEFGIGKSSASRFMAINDRFSKDGNSPVLTEQYKDFSSSKLSEMLTMTDDQLEQVSIGTTVAEIREIKQPVKEEVVATSQQESNEIEQEFQCFDKLAAYWCKRNITVELYELAKSDKDEDIDVFNHYFKEKYIHDGYAPAHDTPGYEISYKTDKSGIHFVDDEKTGYSWQLFIDLVHQELDNDSPAAKPANYHENEEGLKRIKSIRKELKNSKSVTESVEAEPEYIETVSETVDNEPEIVNDVDEADTPERECSNCNYNDMDPDEYRRRHLIKPTEFPCNNCDDKLNHWEPKAKGIVLDCHNPEEGWHKEIIADEPEEVETVEVDIIQTVPENTLFKRVPIGLVDANGKQICEGDILLHGSDTYHVHWFQKEARFVAEAVKKNYKYADLEEWPMYRINECAVLYSIYGDEPEPIQEEPEQLQPELPILKNNDQRKDFIDTYETWPIWIDCKETGERYYRYDLSDKVAMVIKVSWKHTYAGYHESKDYEFGAEQYYLLGVKSEWSATRTQFIEDESRTFAECSTNKSALVDYLKEIQKKG
jgi:hypothetical protein